MIAQKGFQITLTTPMMAQIGHNTYFPVMTQEGFQTYCLNDDTRRTPE